MLVISCISSFDRSRATERVVTLFLCLTKCYNYCNNFIVMYFKVDMACFSLVTFGV